MFGVKMKYIVFDGVLNEEPVVFSSTQNHSNVAWCLESLLGEPVSAGFVEVIDGEIRAYGHSEGLNLQSRKIDTTLIRRHLGANDD